MLFHGPKALSFLSGSAAIAVMLAAAIRRSVRAYCETDNRWIYPSASYGPSYYQWNANAGTSATPNVIWNGQGELLPAGTKVKNIYVKGRGNNAELQGLEVALRTHEALAMADPASAVDSTGEIGAVDILAPTPVLGFTGGNAADMRLVKIPVDYTTVNDGDLHVFFKPVGTLTARRYYYLTYFIELE